MPGIPMNLGDQYVNPVLTQMSVRFTQTVEQVARKVFKPIRVDLPSGSYWEWDRGAWYRTEAQRRAPGTRAAMRGYNRSLKPFQTDLVAIGHPITDQMRWVTPSASMLDLDRAGTELVTKDQILGIETRWANGKADEGLTGYFGAGVWATNITGVAGVPGANQIQQWDQGGSDPTDDVQSLILDNEEKHGVRLNTAVIGVRAYQKLINNASIIDRIKYVKEALPGTTLTPKLLAALWEVNDVHVVRTVVNTGNDTTDAAPAVGSPGMGFMANSKGVLLCYVPSSPSIETPACGYTFEWSMGGTVGENGQRIKSYREEATETTFIESQTAYGFKQVAADLGIFIASCVA